MTVFKADTIRHEKGVVRQKNYGDFVPNFNLVLMKRIAKYARQITLAILSLISVAGMIECKQTWERLKLDGENTFWYECYFWGFASMLFLVGAYIALSWVFSKWALYQLLKNGKTEAELTQLKRQIDPHFFFNSLNNLYGLAIEKSDKAPEVILTLSEMMRHTIYEGDKPTVALKDEVHYLRKYIEMHEIRYQKQVDINFDSDTDRPDYQVPPMMLVTLLENAFKHGVGSLTKEAFIDVQLEAKHGNLHFSVNNNYEEKPAQKPGIGLQNLKRRLQLMYPGQHLLALSCDQQLHHAHLQIPLA